MRFSLHAAAVAAALLAVGCGDEHFSTGPEREPGRLRINPPDATIGLNEVLRLQALPVPDGEPTVGGAVVWRSSDPGVAEVSGDGVVVGLRAGSAFIQASREGHRASARVTVVERGPVCAASAAGAAVPECQLR